MNHSIYKIAEILDLDITGLHDCTIEHLLTDSRSLVFPETTLFVALHTHNDNAVRFIPSLYEAGVRNFVIETDAEIDEKYSDANFLRVVSPIAALHSIAAANRNCCHIPVVGITGSRGKTTVKEWLYQLLREDKRVARSPRSYNSQIGVPLSLWTITPDSDVALIETGVSQENEMQSLRAIVKPTIGVITNLGDEHSEGFSSIYKKGLEKCTLFTDCNKVIYCADDDFISRAIDETTSENSRSGWTRLDADVPLKILSETSCGDTTTIEYRYYDTISSATVPFIDTLDIENAITCMAVMLAMGYSPDVIACRIARLQKVGTRIDVVEGCNNCVLLLDSFTADYESLASALDFMARRSTPDRNTTVILSDVMHEATDEAEIYGNIARLLRLKNIDHIIAIGKAMLKHRNLFGNNAQFFLSPDDFLQQCSVSDFNREQILIKNSPEYDFEGIVEMLEARTHETVLEVNLDALASNYNFYRSRLSPGTKIVCMLKASGYGAGSYELAKTLQDRGAGYIAVAVVDEGVDLRNAGITMPIMVLNPKVVNYKEMFAHRLEPEIFSIDICREIIREAEKYGITNYPVHIKLDTGMHRLGFLKEQLPELITLLQGQNAIKPCSVFSHLAVADMADDVMDAYTKSQFDYFDECATILQSGFNHYILRHILNTAGIMRFPEHQYDMVRLGIGLYGVPILNDGSEDALRQVSSLSTMIISIKEWDCNATIGYGRKGVLHRPSRIATIPIGYADGLNRHLGNGNCKVWVNATYCPTVGNICMDACMIDVTEADCTIGDRVEIFGPHIPVHTLSDALDTIPYEILTSISTRVKRVYYRE